LWCCWCCFFARATFFFHEQFIFMNAHEPADLPLLVVAGPTASGKSALAVALARHFSGEIVACDSTQLYRGVNIGTAKPTVEERGGIAHHLIDVLEPSEAATAGGYRDMALAALVDLRARGKMPILVVGTGLYMRALLEGLADLPLRSEELRERLRASAEKHGPAHLHGVLRRMDGEAAGKIAATDEQKLIRAIEVCVLTRKPISEVHRAGRTPLTGWRVLKIGLMPERELLYRRIEARTVAMLESGWLAEVRGLLAAGVAEDAKIFDFIGYREMLAVARETLKIEDARAGIQQATRNYAKRQMTWFRKDLSIKWFAGAGDDVAIRDEVVGWVGQEIGVSDRG
jgi:tRNA dimethylallyltransferase